MKKRKIVQIAIATGDQDTEDRLVALADDGTVWWCLMQGNGSWRKVTPLPDAT